MSHDVYAAWVSSELAQLFSLEPRNCFADDLCEDNWGFVATRESHTHWPLADGVLYGERANGDSVEIAVELKRTQEGVHGVLTALGQGHAYRDKGFDGTAIVIPDKYPTLEDPGPRLARIIETTSPHQALGVVVYSSPDSNQISPFKGRLRVIRPVSIGVTTPNGGGRPKVSSALWTHLREGSSDADIFYRYLQTARLCALHAEALETLHELPQPLVDACLSKRPDLTPHQYLARTPGDAWHDRVWRQFWYRWVFVEESRTIWRQNYVPNESPTKLRKGSSDDYKVFFVGRSDSIKSKLCRKLIAEEITEEQAWQDYAENVHKRAHSFREDVDSPLEFMGLIDETGRPTSNATQWLEIADRIGHPGRGLAATWLNATFMKRGRLNAFLHYVFKLSEVKFQGEPAAFTNDNGGRFDQVGYRAWLHEQMATVLRAIRTAQGRGGQLRNPFQAELAFLASAGIIPKNRNRFRSGVGLVINWPALQQLQEIEIGEEK